MGRPDSPSGNPRRRTVPLSGERDQSRELAANVRAAVLTRCRELPYDRMLQIFYASRATLLFLWRRLIASGTQDAAGDSPSLGRDGAAVVRDDVEPRLRETDLAEQSSETPASVKPPHVPRLLLDRQGDIQDLNRAACRALDCSDDEPLSSRSFFSLIDGRNLRRVMWDLARMIKRKVQEARWLLRLRTGTGRWRWYRVAANNKLRFEGTIQLTLRPLGSPA